MNSEGASERARGLAALVLVQVCFGLFPLFGKWAFAGEAFTPRAVAGFRVVGGALLLGLPALFVYGRRVLPPAGDVARLLVCALLGVVLNQGLYLEGLSRSRATHAGLVMCLVPVFTYALAGACRQEVFRWLRVAGIALAFAGAALLLVPGGAASPGADPDGSIRAGDLLMAANALSFALFLVVSRPLARRHPPLLLIAWIYAFSLLALPWFWRDAPLPAPGTPARPWLALGLIVLLPTSLAYLLNTYALARVAASTAAFFIYLQPFIAGAAGRLALGERFAGRLVPAAALLLAGLFLVLWRRSTRPAAEEERRCAR